MYIHKVKDSQTIQSTAVAITLRATLLSAGEIYVHVHALFDKLDFII